jgi:hypothetical protein
LEEPCSWCSSHERWQNVAIEVPGHDNGRNLDLINTSENASIACSWRIAYMTSSIDDFKYGSTVV